MHIKKHDIPIIILGVIGIVVVVGLLVHFTKRENFWSSRTAPQKLRKDCIQYATMDNGKFIPSLLTSYDPTLTPPEIDAYAVGACTDHPGKCDGLPQCCDVVPGWNGGPCYKEAQK